MIKLNQDQQQNIRQAIQKRIDKMQCDLDQLDLDKDDNFLLSCNIKDIGFLGKSLDNICNQIADSLTNNN